MPAKDASAPEDGVDSITTIAALLFLAERFPHRQFNSAECTMARLDAWLADHRGFKRG